MRITFLGTGNFQVPGRYWNGFLLGERVMVEAPPTALAHLNRLGVGIDQIEVIFLSHFQADHIFGWPFLRVEWLLRQRSSPLWVVGPPGVEAALMRLIEAGALTHAFEEGLPEAPLRFVEVTGDDQEAGGVHFRAEQVDHVPYLECFGFVIDCDGRRVGYSGDGQLSDGLRRIAARSDVLVLECNGTHSNPSHMSVDDVRTLREEFPSLPFLLTHVGEGVSAAGIDQCRLPDDFEVVEA